MKRCLLVVVGIAFAFAHPVHAADSAGAKERGSAEKRKESKSPQAKQRKQEKNESEAPGGTSGSAAGSASGSSREEAQANPCNAEKPPSWCN